MSHRAFGFPLEMRLAHRWVTCDSSGRALALPNGSPVNLTARHFGTLLDAMRRCNADSTGESRLGFVVGAGWGCVQAQWGYGFGFGKVRLFDRLLAMIEDGAYVEQTSTGFIAIMLAPDFHAATKFINTDNASVMITCRGCFKLAGIGKYGNGFGVSANGGYAIEHAYAIADDELRLKFGGKPADTTGAGMSQGK